MFQSATRAAGLLAVVAATGALGSSQAAPAQQPAFRAGVETVAVYATVQDADGRLVPNLTREDFEIRDNGLPAEITTFSSDPVPITVVLLLDMSGSMGREFLNVRRATSHFFSTLLAGDRVRLGTFGLEIALSPLLTGDRDVLDRILDEEVWPDGPTPLWAAMRDGMRSLAAESGRRVVLALTDGDDACQLPGGMCSSAGQVEDIALDEGFMVYAIGMEGEDLAGRLADLSEKSGGGHRILQANAELAAAFADVAAELHHQYSIGFTPAARDGRTHRLEVRVLRNGLMARARQSYRAPGGGAP
jgi:VWFA-related protein